MTVKQLAIMESLLDGKSLTNGVKRNHNSKTQRHEDSKMHKQFSGAIEI
jgi:hypothetical protein